MFNIDMIVELICVLGTNKKLKEYVYIISVGPIQYTFT